MRVKIIAFAAFLVVQSPALAASDPPPRVPKNPPPVPALTPIPAGEAVFASWGKAKLCPLCAWYCLGLSHQDNLRSSNLWKRGFWITPVGKHLLSVASSMKH
jgi:hypothetical protein